MVAIAFLSQGAAYGMTFGMAGAFIGPASVEFSASRTAASLGASLVALLHGLLGPLVGMWLARGSVRTVMTVGAVLMGIAFLLMHFATNIWMFSLAFGLLGGAAVSCLGVTAVTTLVGRWFTERSGRALGFANMPILITLLPPLAGFLTVRYGWRTTALVIALVAFALVPLFRLVRDPPGYESQHVAAAHEVKFRPNLLFWLLTIAIGILEGSGITIITHLIPYATESGVDYQSATLLVSVMGFCGLAGAPTLGFLADRVGGPQAIAVVAVLLFGAWAALLTVLPFTLLVMVSGLLGFCGGAFAGLIGTSLARLYRGAMLGPAIGTSVLVALPFNFLLPLMAGYVHDVTGDYRLAITYQLALFVISFVLLMVVARSAQSPRG